MMHSTPRRVLASASLLAVAIIFTSLSESRAAESPKIDLAEAKAELAKAKAEKQANEERGSEAKTERKRFFKRHARSEAEEEADQAPEPKPDEAADRERKSRFRLLGRASEESKPGPEVEKPAEEAVVEDEDEEPAKLKRFSPFRLLREESPPTSPEEVKKPETEPAIVAKTTSSAEAPESSADEQTDDERKGFFRGRFAKRFVADAPEEAEKAEAPLTEVDPSDAPEGEMESERGGSLFGFFRRDDTKDFAKAEKTKLGNSVESEAAAAQESGAVAKKSSSTGELGWYVVTETKTPFYAVGPGQPMPPEKVLDRGSMLTVTKGGWGWCNVKLGTGQLGVVSAKAMRPATLAEVSRHSQTGATASSSRGSSRLFNILSRGPAPKPELPTSSGSGPIRNFGLLPSLGAGE